MADQALAPRQVSTAHASAVRVIKLARRKPQNRSALPSGPCNGGRLGSVVESGLLFIGKGDGQFTPAEYLFHRARVAHRAQAPPAGPQPADLAANSSATPAARAAWPSRRVKPAVAVGAPRRFPGRP